MKIFLPFIFCFCFLNCASAQYSLNPMGIIGIRVGGNIAKYKFNQFPLQPPVVMGTGVVNLNSTISPSFQPSYSISAFYKKIIFGQTWLDLELGIRSRGYKSYYANVGNNLISQEFNNRFTTVFATASLQLNITQLWYAKPGIRFDAIINKKTNPNFEYWVSKYSTIETSPVLATGIILPKLNIELEVNPGLMNLVKFPPLYNASSSKLRSFSIGLSVAYKVRKM